MFDRDASYDPRLDPVVRTEARRLRAKLEKYYATAGSHDPIRIVLRKGSYSPEFAPTAEVTSGVEPVERVWKRSRKWIG